ncbi:hypothetical protein GOODEAATRI_016133 [Goodea atripinnis]|uniref:Uncharacterized protein n=1 Tax=Goodea atripinnis TaxID=208336 RepID=A0ABV0PEH6_9TELE
MYEGKWFHDCTSTGREDGHLWCATTYNYDRDQLWGFCPVKDQPSHAEEENCVVVKSESSGRWQNRDCSDALPYACKKRPNATLDPFTTEKSEWNAAQRACQKMDGNLVSIHTLPELEFIIRSLKKDLDQLWIGLHDTDMQMDFQWTDRTPVIFTFWHPFEPNNFRNTQEDCVSMWGPVSNLCTFT